MPNEIINVKNSPSAFMRMFNTVLSSLRLKNAPVLPGIEAAAFKKQTSLSSVSTEGQTDSDNDSVDSAKERDSLISFSVMPMPKVSINKLRTATKPITPEKYAFKACYNQLIIIEKVMQAFLDKIPAWRFDDIEQYDQSKENIQLLRTAFDHLLKIPAPEDLSEYPAYSAKIIPIIHYIKKIMNELASDNTNGRKNFLLSRFYLSYLRVFSKTYLFEAQKTLSEQESLYFSDERQEAEEMLSALTQKHKANPFYQKTTPNLFELYSMIHSHEERINLANKLGTIESTEQKPAQSTEDICSSLSSNIKIEKALNQLIMTSIDVLSELLEKPEKYLPTSNNKQKDSQLLDLIFYKKPNEYKLLLEKSPESLEKLKQSFAFTHDSIQHYFSQPRGVGSLEQDYAATDELLNRLRQKKQELNQQDEDTYSEVSDPDSDADEGCFWEKSEAGEKKSKPLKEIAMPPLSEQELDETMHSAIKPASKPKNWLGSLFSSQPNRATKVLPTEERILRID